MQATLNRQKLCFEDFEWGTGTVEQTRGGVLVELTQLNVANLPYDDTQTLQEYLDSIGNGDMTKAIYDTNNNGIVDNSELVNGLTVETAVPAGALFTDTVYDPNAVETLTNKTMDNILNYIGANHIHYPIRNESGSLITKGTVITGSTTQPGTDYIEVKPRTLATEIALGIAHSNIANNETGLAINTGVCIDMVDTSAWDEGTILYPNTSGGLTDVKPTSGLYQACAVVTRSHATQGTLLVEFTEPKEVNWDDRYYTETEMDNLLAGKSDTTHDHAGVYEPADADITKQGNTFNGVSQLVQTDGTGKLPAIDGSALLNLPSGFSDPMTTRGDIIIRDSSNITNRLPVGTVGQILKSDGTDIAWSALSVTEAQISDLGTTIVLDTDIGSTVQAYNANNALTSDITFETLNTNGDIGTGSAQVAAGDHNHSGVYEPADATILKDADIGSTVQPYDADIAKTDVTQTFTLPQRAAVTTDNDLSFDLATTNNFKCTPAATGQLTFTNLADGQGGRIVLDNSGGYIITKNSLVLASSTFLNTISTAGKYLIGYECDGVNVFINSTEALV